MVLVYYISSHGLGHASRSIELIDALTARRADDLRIVVRSNAPAWVFERLRKRAVEVQTCETDSGVAQHDSLSVNEDETAARAAVFYRDFDQRVAAETIHLRKIGANLVVSDIAPLAFAAALNHAGGRRPLPLHVCEVSFGLTRFALAFLGALSGPRPLLSPSSRRVMP